MAVDQRSLRVRRALLSAYDPSPFLPLAEDLSAGGVELWATTGTAQHLRDHGLTTRPTDELTGIVSWFHGRVKTLHPSVFGGILAPRTEEGLRELDEHHLVPFDLVAVHLYPFEEALARGETQLEKLIELIDIGGPSILRAAAKNFAWVAPIPGPREAERVREELRATGGSLSYETRRSLAAAVFRRTALYDTAILSGLGGGGSRTPSDLLALERHDAEHLRYGENPHQGAWVYGFAVPPVGISPWPLTVEKGEALSYNNYLDLETALSIVSEFEEPATAVVKHATPCGVAAADRTLPSLAQALATDSVARYGCVIATNRPFGEAEVDALKGTFVDLLVCPGFESGVLERLSKRSKIKVVRFGGQVRDLSQSPRNEARTATGRLLLQECDQRSLSPATLRQVSKRAATPTEMGSLLFAWSVVRYVRSNAIVLSLGKETVGIGGGQTSRVGAVEAALAVAGPRSAGSVMASDAYFPFPDGVEVAGKAGVTAVIHPGGSIRDAEVIAAADRCGLAMYTTGWRAFRH